jgi:hypothetical protein
MALLGNVGGFLGGRSARAAALLAGFWLALPALSFAQSYAGEQQIKAVFLLNFSQFVAWPAEAFPTPDSPLVLGILGRDPFGRALDEAVTGERSGSHPLEVRRYRTPAEIQGCHILFISDSETPRLKQILPALQNRSILTVSNARDFAHYGGMIRFLTENNRIRLRINLAAARAAGLTLSSKLLRPAEIVGSDKEAGQ